MTLNENERYLFWFETKQDDAVIKSLEEKLARLGVHAEIINGIRRPALIKFGQSENKKPVPARVLSQVAQ